MMKKLWLAVALALALAAPSAKAQQPLVFPAPTSPGSTPLTASATGTTGTITATLTGAASKWTYICGFVLTSASTTTAAVVDATVTGVPTTMNFQYVYVSSGQGILGIAFPGCITSSAENTNIVVTLPAGGAGSVNAISAWGYTN